MFRTASPLADYFNFNSASYYFGGSTFGALFDDGAFGSSFLANFFGSSYFSGPGAGGDPYGSFNIYDAYGDGGFDFWGDGGDDYLATGWDTNWSPLGDEPPPIVDAEDEAAAAASGVGATYSYTDYNSLLGGKASVGVTVLSDILAVTSTSTSNALLRDVGGVAISGGRHELKVVQSNYQASGGLAVGNAIASVGFQPLLISDREVLTTPALRARYETGMARAERVAGDRAAPYWGFHPDTEGRTNVACVTQLVTEVNGTLIAGAADASKLLGKTDAKMDARLGPVPSAVVSQFTGSAAVWRSAVIRLRAFSSATSVVERGWEDVIGEMGGTLTLLMLAGNVVVTITLLLVAKAKEARAAGKQAQEAPGAGAGKGSEAATGGSPAAPPAQGEDAKAAAGT